MKPMRVREVLRLLKSAGWLHVRTRGSHHIFRHPLKSGTVTVPGNPSRTIPVGTLKAIFRQAQMEAER